MKNIYVVGIILVLTIGATHAQQIVPRENAPLMGVPLPGYHALDINHPIEDVVIQQSTRCARFTLGDRCHTGTLVVTSGMLALFFIWSNYLNPYYNPHTA